MKVTFDQDAAKIAISVTGSNLAQCKSQWESYAPLADLIEWRLDFLEVGLRAECAQFAQQMRSLYGLPILATYRTESDGGKSEFRSTKDYEEALANAAGWADLLDVETSFPGSARLIERLRDQIPVVASFHDFTSGPSLGLGQELLRNMESLGASVGKAAWMVRNQDDVNIILQLQKCAAEKLSMPTVVIGMGPLGTVTRLGDSAKLSAFTFARGEKASAPGQPTAEEIRNSVQGA